MCGTYLESLTPKEYVGNQYDTFHPLFKGQEGQEAQIKWTYYGTKKFTSIQFFRLTHFGNFNDLLLSMM